MKKHVIMQKLLNSNEVSDSLFRKIYQFLDIADSNNVEKLIELFKGFYPEEDETSENFDENGAENSENLEENFNENSENKDESQVFER